ncbi:MAG: hypothetical protein LUF84_08455 [Clostridiales bacterium]|nr:hypothetical protein [Clostridiales bacterium]
MIKGIPVVLYERTQTGSDPFNKPIYEETATTVENVLVAPSSEEEILDVLNLTGRKAVYTLGIPKGDTHDWEDKDVAFFGERWHTIGMPISGIDAMIPLSWNTKVRVERYGQQAEN